jgi:AraC-like DNA-binding protein
MDPLNDIFAAMRVESALYARLQARAPWGVSLTAGKSARFGMVVDGACWLSVPGMAGPIRLTAGDCYVIIHGLPYRLQDDLASPAPPCTEVIQSRISAPGGAVEIGGDGAPATVITGWFVFDAQSAKPLMDLIPPLLHVRMDQERTELLQSTLQLFARETAERGLGSDLVVSRLADVIFVQAIRAHVAAAGDGGWLSALADRRLGGALRAIHRDIARSWTVEALAGEAGLSRSAFALRFKQRVGETPLDYVTRWRMFRAGCLLRQSEEPIARIASRVGYESEAAFGKAFKRAVGQPPGSYRRQRGGSLETTASAA